MLNDAGLEFIGFDLYDKAVLTGLRKMVTDDFAAKNLSNVNQDTQDLIGIAATRLNAELIKSMLPNFHEKIILLASF